MSIAVPGKCRHCGCTEEDACTLPAGDLCLLDQQRQVCSSPACIRAEAERLAAAGRNRSKYAGWGYGAILTDLRKQEKGRPRRRRKKAA